MNLFKLAKIIDKKISSLHIEPNLCTQTISPKSSCRQCLDVCPANAISISDKRIDIDDQCVECGLCSTVCPTNAIFFERPSFWKILQEAARKCKNEEHVYLQCQKLSSHLSPSATVTVPCLGALPREAWLTLINDNANLSVYCEKESCRQCEFSSGYSIWQQELKAGEEMAGKKMAITDNIQDTRTAARYDRNRRELFAMFAGELKSMHNLIIKETINDRDVPSYQEKLHQDEAAKVRKEWKSVAMNVLEELMDEPAAPYMKKRKLLLNNVDKISSLRERKDVRLPAISPDCHFCGACSLLCPTGALMQTSEDGKKKITLQPDLCVDCQLCEQICFFEHLKLEQVTNKHLLSGELILTEKMDAKQEIPS